jgi:hypothetical protein
MVLATQALEGTEALFGSEPPNWTQVVVPPGGMTVVPVVPATSRLRLYPVPVAVLTTPRDLAALVRLQAPLTGIAGGVEFVAEDSASSSGSGSAQASTGAAVAYEPASAMPIRLYRVPGTGAGAGVSQYVLQVPSGMFDDPNAATGGYTYTFLSHDMRYIAASYQGAPRWPASALTLADD